MNIEMKKKKCLGAGPIAGIVVTVIAWFLVSVFYTMRYLKIEPLDPQYESEKGSIGFGESHIYKLPDAHGYADIHSHYDSGLVQVYKRLSDVQLSQRVENRVEGFLKLDPKSYSCETMFLLPNSTIEMSMGLNETVYAQVMTEYEYKRLKGGQDYVVIDEWTSEGRYTADRDPMDYVFCFTSNSTQTLEFSYKRIVKSTMYDIDEAYKICNNSKCVYKDLHSGYSIVITNLKKSDETIKYEVLIGYDKVYRYICTAVLWAIPVVVGIGAVICVVISKCCCKSGAVTYDIYDPIASVNASNNSFDYSRNSLVDSNGKYDSSYLLYCSDEDI